MKTKEVASKIDTEKALVAKVQFGNAAEKETAFTELFKIYKPQILQKMNLGVHFDQELAKDLLMDIFTKVHMNIGSYNPTKGAFSTWIYEIAKNRLIDYKRTERYEVLSIEELNVRSGGEEKDDVNFAFQIADESRSSNGHDIMVLKERADFTLEALNSIKNDVVRESMRLRFIEDIPYEKISEQMNIPIGSVKAYVNRGKIEMETYILKKFPNFNK
jgi:RNA polymerase sigma-70 factor (ECF subfamily)